MKTYQNIIISGKDAETVSYLLIDSGALGAVEKDDGRVELFYDSDSVSRALNSLSKDYEFSIEHGEPVDSSLDYVSLSSSKWYPIDAGQVRIIPVLGEETRKHSPHDVLLRPGSGFGTGHHPTTRMLIASLIKKSSSMHASHSLWDIGAGSGILGIIFRKLTGGTVTAWEYDSLAIANAKDNIQLNAQDLHFIEEPFAGGIYLSKQSVDLPDLIVANLYSDLHREFSEEYYRCLNSGGVLMISGVLYEQWSDLREYFPCNKWNCTEISRLGAWLAVSFARK